MDFVEQKPTIVEVFHINQMLTNLDDMHIFYQLYNLYHSIDQDVTRIKMNYKEEADKAVKEVSDEFKNSSSNS